MAGRTCASTGRACSVGAGRAVVTGGWNAARRGDGRVKPFRVLLLLSPVSAAVPGFLASLHPSAVSLGSAVKKVNIIAMGTSRVDFDSMQLVEQRPDILIDAETWGINYMGAIKRLEARVTELEPPAIIGSMR